MLERKSTRNVDWKKEKKKNVEKGWTFVLAITVNEESCLRQAVGGKTA